MKVLKRISLFIIILLIVLSTKSKAIYGVEEIYSYKSEIYIQEDSSMIVEETIEVYSAGIEIKKGIYRDFPTKYKDKNGNNYNVGFEVLEVLKNGEKETYTEEKKGNGVRVRIGNANKTLMPGYYTYTIKYKTTRQLGFFKDHDELYWNVTGNGWNFAIDNVTAVVHLPNGADMDKVDYEAHTGDQGSKGKEYTAYKSEYDNTVTFYTTSKLSSKEGLTIVVGFEKGLVHEPTFKEKVQWFFQDNKGIFIGLCVSALLVVYCYITWAKVGKDPKKDIIIPRYSPPDGLSPADVKYIDSMGKYDKVFEASILNLAIKGYIKIETEEKNIFGFKSNKMTLIKQNKELENDISEDERSIYDSLSDTTVLEYDSYLQRKLMIMQSGQRSFLKKKMEGTMYSKNAKYITFSVIISIIALILAFVFSTHSEISIMVVPFMSIWLSGWTAGIVAMLKNGKGAKKIANIIFAIPFLIGEVIGIGVLIVTAGLGIALLVLLLVVINVVYAFLIKAYTKEGRRIKDEIEGFKLFIKTASEDEIMNQTPETFDKYFPYAYALGLENEWAKKFENVLESYNYEPTWCTGMYYHSSFHVATFTSSFSSSFSNSISSASTAPGSSSGFSGGGRRRWLFWRWRPEAGGGGGW